MSEFGEGWVKDVWISIVPRARAAEDLILAHDPFSRVNSPITAHSLLLRSTPHWTMMIEWWERASRGTPSRASERAQHQAEHLMHDVCSWAHCGWIYWLPLTGSYQINGQWGTWELTTRAFVYVCRYSGTLTGSKPDGRLCSKCHLLGKVTGSKIREDAATNKTKCQFAEEKKKHCLEHILKCKLIKNTSNIVSLNWIKGFYSI